RFTKWKSRCDMVDHWFLAQGSTPWCSNSNMNKIMYAVLVLATLPVAGGRPPIAPDAIVAQDGSGQYTSIQDAINRSPARPSKSDRRWIILVKPGTYREIVYIQREYTNLAIVGEDTEHTILTYN